jgi:hypothetical protein
MAGEREVHNGGRVDNLCDSSDQFIRQIQKRHVVGSVALKRYMGVQKKMR